MKATVILLTLLSTAILSSCVQPTRGGYATGQRSASINEGRSDPRAITSEARLSQNRRQRTNEIEESRHERELRYNDRDEMLSPLKTANEAMGLIRGIGFGIR
jgi:hypothetical protein